MNKNIKITADREPDILILFIILCAGLYGMSQSPTLALGIFVLVIFLVAIFRLFARDSLTLYANDEGVAISKIWYLTGPKEYKYTGLSKAKEIIFMDVASAAEAKLIKQSLVFKDGSKLPLPEGDGVRMKIKAWFEEVYKLKLEVREDK